ncbi:hypothetical protein NH340_JMT06642 [Sarcoptes scabiei]|nr:hypothetical protein NH340_JMT06642 [Sarcoptes scabiei]
MKSGYGNEKFVKKKLKKYTDKLLSRRQSIFIFFFFFCSYQSNEINHFEDGKVKKKNRIFISKLSKEREREGVTWQIFKERESVSKWNRNRHYQTTESGSVFEAN